MSTPVPGQAALIERESGGHAAAGRVAAPTRWTPAPEPGQKLRRHVQPTGERALHGAEHPLAHLEIFYLGADFGDDAAQVATDRTGVSRMKAEDVEDVAEVQPSGLHSDLNLVVGRRCDIGLGGKPEVVDRAAFGRRQDVVVAVASAVDRCGSSAAIGAPGTSPAAPRFRAPPPRAERG